MFVLSKFNVMRKGVLLLMAFVYTGCLLAQVKISGIVKDNRGRALRGASISIKDSYDGATSDSLGAFAFTTTEKGDQLLTVTNLGYKSFEQKISFVFTWQLGLITKNYHRYTAHRNKRLIKRRVE